MAYVNISEVRTFADAVSAYGGRSAFSVGSAADLTIREISQKTLFIPTYVLGTLWNVAAQNYSVEYALKVAQEHFDVQRVYGEWGEAIDAAPTISERLHTGIALMHAHTDDPRWSIDCGDQSFGLTRQWSYRNTRPRAEAFATICELREWLIVMQRDIADVIQPLAVHLMMPLWKSLTANERIEVERFFGCPLCPERQSALIFPNLVLGMTSFNADPDRLRWLCKRLMPRDKQQSLVVPRVYMTADTWMKPLPQRVAPKTVLRNLDFRHRDSLNRAAYDAAVYFESLAHNSKRLNGVDLGGGSLGVTSVFLHHFRSMTSAAIHMSVVDPVASEGVSFEKQLRIPITIYPNTWDEFDQATPDGHQFNFIFCCQVMSLLSDAVVEEVMRSIFRRLVPGGRFFAAFEPYDHSTLSGYQNLNFFQRPVDWYRDLARRVGFIVDDTAIYTAHADDFGTAMMGLRMRKNS